MGGGGGGGGGGGFIHVYERGLGHEKWGAQGLYFLPQNMKQAPTEENTRKF